MAETRDHQAPQNRTQLDLNQSLLADTSALGLSMHNYISTEKRQPHHFAGNHLTTANIRPNSSNHFQLVQQPLIYYPTLMSTNLLLSGMLQDPIGAPIMLNASQDHINRLILDNNHYLRELRQSQRADSSLFSDHLMEPLRYQTQSN